MPFHFIYHHVIIFCSFRKFFRDVSFLINKFVSCIAILFLFYWFLTHYNHIHIFTFFFAIIISSNPHFFFFQSVLYIFLWFLYSFFSNIIIIITRCEHPDSEDMQDKNSLRERRKKWERKCVGNVDAKGAGEEHSPYTLCCCEE